MMVVSFEYRYKHVFEQIQNVFNESLKFAIILFLKVWVLTVDNYDVKRYTCTEAMCEFIPS